MKKFVNLIDYLGNSSIVEIDNIEDIETMVLLEVSGDEVLFVKYRDGQVLKLDSNETRYWDILDDIKFVTFDDLIVVEQNE